MDLLLRQLSCGVARIDITPPPGIAHAGWGAQTHQRAAGVDLPLWATALALSDGDETVVIVDIDLVYLWEAEASKALQAVAALTGLPQSHIRLSYTHTHSGPVTGSGWTSWFTEGAEMVEAYDESLPHRIAGVGWEAIKNLVPARVAAGRGSCGIAVNRRFQRPEDGTVVVGRNWDGPTDKEVQVVRVDDLSGQPLAAVVNYACHPITVGPDCELITPDYPGVVKRVVEDATGATCLFLQGAAGDIGPARGVARHGLHEYERLGAILGHEASRVWWELELPRRQEAYISTLESGAPLAVYEEEPIEDTEVGLRVGTRSMQLPIKGLPAPEQLEADLAGHLKRLDELRTKDAGEEAIIQATMLAKRAKMRADMARQLQGQTHRDFEAQVFTIGDRIALAAIPGEPFVEIGLQIKRQSPIKHTLFSGYSNVGWAYIPVAEAYPEGGYEVEVTPFSPDAAGIVVTETLSLLDEVSQR